MNTKLEKKLDYIDKLAEKDDLYQYMMEGLKEYEEELFDLERELSEKQRDILWRFIMRSEEISRRKLVIACKNMTFRSAIKKFFCNP